MSPFPLVSSSVVRAHAVFLGLQICFGCVGGIADEDSPPNGGPGSAGANNMPRAGAAAQGSGTVGTAPGIAPGAVPAAPGTAPGTSVTPSAPGSPPMPSADPGRITMRRLTRTEYSNMARDLLGRPTPVADAFPGDDETHGFDNNAETLGIATSQLEQYDRAADTLAGEVLKPGAARDRFVTCPLASGAACVRSVLGKFTRRAWRRLPSAAEITDLGKLVDGAVANGLTIEEAARAGLRAALLSPHFLFKVETDPDPRSAVPHPVTSFEMASRLSYFLWSSLPDDALLQAAEVDKLQASADVRQQALRMLDDSRADALVDNFAAQWLKLRALNEHPVDTKVLSSYDGNLVGAMQRESKLFVKELIAKARPLGELMWSDTSFLDNRLARHYGLPDPGAAFVRVTLPAGQRGGVLGQAAVLTATSYRDRTSIVKRGQWVMGSLLCSEPPPPPNAVDALPPPGAKGTTLRQRMESHRAQPLCAACHRQMDAIGLGLENFDAVGRFRTLDLGQPIDATGELPDGNKFDGPRALGQALARDPALARCAAEKLFTFALGRPPTVVDGGALEQIVGTAGNAGTSFRDLIGRLVSSNPFRLRRGQP